MGWRTTADGEAIWIWKMDHATVDYDNQMVLEEHFSNVALLRKAVHLQGCRKGNGEADPVPIFGRP